jgi:hypothetical protein
VVTAESEEGEAIPEAEAESESETEAEAPSRDVGDGGAEALLEAAWARLLERWDDPEAHKKFRALCAQQDRLDFAGLRYREVQGRDEARAEVAKREIGKIIAVAVAQLETLKSEPKNSRRTVNLIGFAVVFGLLLSVLYMFLYAQQ